MRLPKNVLTNTFRKPNIYLCETDKTKICKLETSNMQASLKFNSYSELSFEVGRTYNDNFTGETKVNPFYDKIEALRLVNLEGFGYFELQGPELIGDGIKESKSIKAYSLEYTLSQKYLEDFYINTGEVNSQEVINAKNEDSIVPIILYNETNPKLSLLNLALEKTYGWTIGHVDPQLKTLSRQFEIDRQSVYDFLMNEVCEKFNCYIVFDTVENTINVYAESPTAKFIGDGTTKTFTIGSANNTFSEVKTVSIDGYKTTQWIYSIANGVGALTLTSEDAPAKDAMIEVVGVDSTWETDVFVTFDNLSQEINVNYDADSIKTVLTVTYGDDGDIRETNLGLPYLVDLSYYCTPEWLGQDLYDAWNVYQDKCNSKQADYTNNTKSMLEYANKIDFEENRLSLEYSIADSVNLSTVGTYYVQGGTSPNFYYTEVSLPSEYVAGTTYYKMDTANLNETKVGNLLTVLKKYFNKDKIAPTEAEIEMLGKEMKKEFDQTSVDLTRRPRVSPEVMRAAGYDVEDGSYATVHTITILSEEVGLTDEHGNNFAINVTPILPDGTVIPGEEEGLKNYIFENVKNGMLLEDLDVFLGVYDTVEEASQAAERLHILQRDYYDMVDGTNPAIDWEKELKALLEESFLFMSDLGYENSLLNDLKGATSNADAETAIRAFLDIAWKEIGRTPLKKLYYKPYKKVQITQIEAGWSQVNSENYGYYYPVVILLESIEAAISKRDDNINEYQSEYDEYQKANANISEELLISNNFTEGQLIRLNAFLREDELHLDDIVETSQDSIDDSFKIKQDAMEAGRIELQKLCQPQLQFSMSMANIYALPEFEPIIDQFKLGNMIKVGIRPDYIKQSRLLQVDINFEDFSDFSCEFGELTSIRSQSDIHADLLKNAISAGKSVAQNASYWTKGSDQATSTDLKIQQGLLDAATAIKSIDGSQKVSIDKYGIHLRKKKEGSPDDSEEYDDKQGWIVNNQFLYSDDAFKTTKAVFGEYRVPSGTIDESGNVVYENRWGLLADAVIAGYIEGSHIKGGTINIGDGAFVVHENGSVTMGGGDDVSYEIDGYVKNDDFDKKITIISDTQPETASNGQMWLNTATTPYTLMVYNNNKWEYFSQGNGETIYVSQPESYKKGDLWVVKENDLYNSCRIVDGLASNCLEKLWRNDTKYYTKNGLEIQKIEYKDYEGGKGELGNYTTSEDGLHHYHIYTSYDSLNLPDPAIIYHQGFFGAVGYNWQASGDTITIHGNANETIYSQSDIKYYGTDDIAQIAINEDVELYLIYSDGEMYLVKKNMVNKFFCEKTTSKFVNGTLLKAIRSSSRFSYDHWIDNSPEDTESQNNIYQHFTFNKETGLKIGQADNKFYVNIDSQKMGFHSIDDNGNDIEVVHIGNNSTEIQNATFDGDNGTTFNNNAIFNQQVNFFGFVWTKEENGSLSLAVNS